MVPATEQASVGQALGRFLDATGRLVAGNLALARTQVQAEAARAARGAALAAAGLVPAVVGWGLVCTAAALALAGWLGLVGALLLLGALNVGAAMLLFVQVKRLASSPSGPTVPEGPGPERGAAA